MDRLIKTIKKVLIVLMSIPKIFYINLFKLPLKQGIKLPILVSYNTKIKIYRGGVILNGNIKFGMICVGLHKGSFNLAKGKSTAIIVNKESCISFNGKAIVCKGAFIRVTKGGRLVLGDNFSCNANFLCDCSNHISFGSDCMIGWDCSILDNDGHYTYLSSEECSYNNSREIIVGNHVWLGAKVTILKGTCLANDTVVAYGSIVCDEYKNDNILIAGSKASIKKERIQWTK